MLYIHPPLSIAGYVFIFIFTALTIKAGTAHSKSTKIAALAAWVLTVLGLFTGMLWAQLAWGSYWSWDIKETLTLALFLALSAGLVAYFERKPQAAKWLMLVTCLLVVVTASSSFILAGLHSYI
jgi:ABC-type transport system involved in cytochrome c biogenesis permease subunit